MIRIRAPLANPARKTLSTDYLRHGRTTAIDDHDDLQVLKRIRRFLLPRDFQIEATLLKEMVDGYDIGDPIADNLVANDVRFAKPLQQTIASGHIPIELRDNADFEQLVSQFSAHPSWYDPKLAEIGAIAYRRYPLMLIWLLRNVALMAGYSIPALSLPLVQTGALTHEALPRLMRTYAYILAVSEYPAINNADSVLTIGSEGWRQSIRVRQIHTMVRQGLLKGQFKAQKLAMIGDDYADNPAKDRGRIDTHQHPDGSWNSDYWGIPINQTDMVATHLQFSLLIMRGLRLLGARISEEEAQGILHLWNMASYWMGVDLQRLPKDETACWSWLYSYLSIQQLDFEMGKPLARALHDLPSQIMGEDNRRGQFVELVNASVTRTLVGDDIGDGLDLPKSKLRFGVLSTVPILFGLDTARQYSDTAADKLEAFRARRQDNMNWWLKQHDDYYRVDGSL
ncbi:MAG: oxygenase MpaB family protein [Psychrobacter sp.]|nr:oxygenase MpaB family protein [Psychrobacter sp.]